MSGPKDYTIVLAAARLAEIAARRAALLRERAEEAKRRREATASRLRKQGDAAAARRKTVAANRQRQAEVEFANLAAANAAHLAAAKSASVKEKSATKTAVPAALNPEVRGAVAEAVFDAQKSLTKIEEIIDVEGDSTHAAWLKSTAALSGHELDLTALAEAQRLRDEVRAMAERVAVQVPRWEAAQERLTMWKEQLADDQVAHQFAANDLAEWQRQADSHSAAPIALATFGEFIDRAEQLSAAAEKLYHDVGQRKSQFDERNNLLRDMITAFQEIGFFVSDPQYEDPNDPAGAVLVTASRGSEIVRASVDLSEMVRTEWNGMVDETCKTSFFNYVDRMRDKGIEVHATRADLKERPILKQAGAKDLPRDGSMRQGG